jgi:glutamate racemase
MDDRPIGFFDSGVGGLSLWQIARSLFPHENMIVVADGGCFPYGALAASDVRDRAQRAVTFLAGLGVKAVVVACNTATVHALSSLRAAFPGFPFVGVVPMVKTLAEQTRSGTIAVLSTPSTAESDYLASLVQQFAPDKRMLNIAGAGLADLVEAGEVRSARAVALLRQYLAAVQASDADVLGLGCTHYLFLREPIEQILGDAVRVYDPALPVLRRLSQVLSERQALAQSRTPSHQLFTTGDARRFTAVARTLLGETVPSGQAITL